MDAARMRKTCTRCAGEYGPRIADRLQARIAAQPAGEWSNPFLAKLDQQHLPFPQGRCPWCRMRKNA